MSSISTGWEGSAREGGRRGPLASLARPAYSRKCAQIVARAYAWSDAAPGGCRIFRGGCDSEGYPVWNREVDGELIPERVQRALLKDKLTRESGTDVPADVNVRPSCGHKRCVSLEHLALATPAGCMAAALQRGSQRTPKFTAEQVAEILALRAAGETIPEIARAYGVGISTIKKIVSGESYRWLREPKAA